MRSSSCQAGVEDDRHERRLAHLVQQRPAEQRLAGAGIAGDDDQAVTTAQRLLHVIDRPRIRAARVQEALIQGRTKRTLLESP